jgi:hypothetical protein
LAKKWLAKLALIPLQKQLLQVSTLDIAPITLRFWLDSKRMHSFMAGREAKETFNCQSIHTPKVL